MRPVPFQSSRATWAPASPSSPSPSAPVPSPGDPGNAWEALLAWYDAEKRDLPWRKSNDPYRILVSEVMLQQTQVKTVLGYYDAFIRRFPDLRALASASEDEVLAAWKGLGYYRRARNLHACAKQAMAEHGGELPSSYDALRKMKGIGEYTAAAVASIAFGEAKGVVDGNVLRVMARYLCIEEPVDDPKVRRSIQQVVDEVIAPERPGDFNQALMELGATVCTPQRPRCEACPLEKTCLARARSVVHRLPARRRREQPSFSRRIVGVVEKAGHVLLVRRPTDGLLGGMWEFLNLEAPKGGRRPVGGRGASPMPVEALQESLWASPEDTFAGQTTVETAENIQAGTDGAPVAPPRGPSEALGEATGRATGERKAGDGAGCSDEELVCARIYALTGDTVARCVYLGRVTHRFSHLVWEMDVYWTEVLPSEVHKQAEGSQWVWQPVERMDDVALPRVMQKVWELAERRSSR